MKCSICKTELVVSGQARLETSEEHVTCSPVSLKDKYECPNEKCVSKLLGACWNEIGEFYSKNYSLVGISFVDGLKSAFGSYSRCAEVEIYKKDENKRICTLPWPMKGWEINKKYWYRADEDGKILKRGWRFEYIRPDGCIHIWGIKMFWYGVKQIWAHRNTNELKGFVERANWPRAEWWRKANGRLAKIFMSMNRNRR